MIPEWLESILFYFVWFWAETLFFSFVYTGVLWMMGSIKFVGWISWAGWIPIARFKLTEQESWFSYAWERFYPHALICIIIHKRDPKHTENAEREIVHEFQFIKWQLAFGLVFYALYAIDCVRLLGTEKDILRDNWFERRASRIEKEWVEGGKPSLFVPNLKNGANA